MAKYYVSRTDVNLVDERIVGTETILTRPSTEEAAHEGARRFRGLGAEGIHVIKHVSKRYNKLLREQNKRRKENPLTVGDIARMTEQADKELNTKPKGGE